MTKILHLIIAIIIAPTYLFSETVTIYATQSAQYSANDCCTLNILTNQNSDSLYSQDCQDMGTYYGCGMSKQVPFWLFDLSTLDSSIDIQSMQFNGNIPTDDWSDVYLSVSTTIGQISTSIASDLWSGGDWASGNGQYSSINWAMGDFSQNLPLDIISQGIISGQLNILTYTSNPWSIFSIVNSGDDAPRLVIDYENIDENCTADDGTEGVELWGQCYSIENTTELNLYISNLTGSIPPEIGNLTNLTDLILHNNQLTGSIPPEIGNLTNLNRLVLFNNQLTGSIPSEIGNLVNLTELVLFNNQLTDSIPPEIGNLTDLVSFSFYNNQLTGSIPSEIGNLINLTQLNLRDNDLTGSIPSEIGNLTNLNYLLLRDNQLTGEIPETICNLLIDWGGSGELGVYFDIYNNQLCPPYPECIEEFVGNQDTSNCSSVSIIEDVIPLTYALYNAYPNPFNPVTTLRYDLPEDGLVYITVYDMLGNVVSNLVNANQSSGHKSIQWNATNNQGEPVSAGVYLYKIQAGDFVDTKKMILLK